MKEEKGITLVSLVIYVIVMTIVIAVMSAITSNFYKNTGETQDSTKDIMGFNKFNTYFLKEIKSKQNDIEDVKEDSYILFKSGNSFSLSDNKIYYNKISICNDVESVKFEAEKDEQNKYTGIINVNIKLKNFEKTIRYKIEEIY